MTNNIYWMKYYRQIHKQKVKNNKFHKYKKMKKKLMKLMN